MAKLKIIRCSTQSGKIEPKSGDENTFEATTFLFIGFNIPFGVSKKL